MIICIAIGLSCLVLLFVSVYGSATAYSISLQELCTTCIVISILGAILCLWAIPSLTIHGAVNSEYMHPKSILKIAEGESVVVTYNDDQRTISDVYENSDMAKLLYFTKEDNVYIHSISGKSFYGKSMKRLSVVYLSDADKIKLGITN